MLFNISKLEMQLNEVFNYLSELIKIASFGKIIYTHIKYNF